MMNDMNDVPDVEIPSIEQIPDSQNNQNEHEISQNYEGAPEMVSNTIESTHFLFNSNLSIEHLITVQANN